LRRYKENKSVGAEFFDVTSSLKNATQLVYLMIKSRHNTKDQAQDKPNRLISPEKIKEYTNFLKNTNFEELLFNEENLNINKEAKDSNIDKTSFYLHYDELVSFLKA
jgi:hypothetical protein